LFFELSIFILPESVNVLGVTKNHETFMDFSFSSLKKRFLNERRIS